MMNEIRFSDRPLSVAEYLLMADCSSKDNKVQINAMVDLLVLRSDPKVTREYLLNFPLQDMNVLCEQCMEQIPKGGPDLPDAFRRM